MPTKEVDADTTVTAPLVNKRNSNYQSTATTAPGKNGDLNSRSANLERGGSPDTGSESDSEYEFPLDPDTTTFWQTVMNLLKGFIGCGILSLPWAVSQLGIPLGVGAIVLTATWCSYNISKVVKLKRYIERMDIDAGDDNDPGETQDARANNDDNGDDDAASVTPSAAPSAASTNTTVTYADLGDWAYGRQFQSYLAVCICIQQIAIATALFAFVGENLLAMFDFYDLHLVDAHWQKITIALPMVLVLSFSPSLRKLAPLMQAGTVLLFLGLISLLIIGVIQWEDRPEHPPTTVNLEKAPLALSAIVFSYEGVCLVLPVESSMEQPEHFKHAFGYAIFAIATLLALVASLSTVAFGDVSNGSITAFLLEKYKHDQSVQFWCMLSNTAFSFSILFTYPSQLVPAAELIGPWLSSIRYCPCSDNVGAELEQAQEDYDKDLAGFEPMPSLPQYGSYHEHYDNDNNDNRDIDGKEENGDTEQAQCFLTSAVSKFDSMFPEMSMPGDSPAIRLLLVLITYFIAVAVPKVEILISLAGAVAGSSAALLIPPILNLGWIHHLEQEMAVGKYTYYNNSATSYFWEKVWTWVLLGFGTLFAVYGTQSSIADIIRFYSEEAEE